MIYLHFLAVIVWGSVVLSALVLNKSKIEASPTYVAIPAFAAFMYALAEVIRLM